MITAQVALAIVLVFGAVIAGRAFVSVLQIPLGFSPDNLIAINARPFGIDPDIVISTRERSTRCRIGSMSSPQCRFLHPSGWIRCIRNVETSASQRPVDVIHVLPGYFETLDIPLVRGRLLSRDDVGREDVAVVSESASRALFPDGNVLGATLRSRSKRQFTVVGIVGDVQRSVSRQLAPPAYALPPQDTNRGMTIVARVRASRTAHAR